MRPIRFVKHSLPYAAGEVAGFPAEVAARHVANGAAVYEGAPTTPVETPREPPPAPTPKRLRRVNLAASLDSETVVSEA